MPRPVQGQGTAGLDGGGGGPMERSTTRNIPMAALTFREILGPRPRGWPAWTEAWTLEGPPGDGVRGPARVRPGQSDSLHGQQVASYFNLHGEGARGGSTESKMARSGARLLAGSRTGPPVCLPVPSVRSPAVLFAVCLPPPLNVHSTNRTASASRRARGGQYLLAERSGPGRAQRLRRFDDSVRN